MSLARIPLEEIPAAPRGAVFVSCALEDAEAGGRIAQSLRSAGLPVWCEPWGDGADGWERRIRTEINECGIFIPIVSARSQSRPEGHFRREWRLADSRAQRMGRSRVFILPVCLDDTREEAGDVPESFLEVPWTRLRIAEAGAGAGAAAGDATADLRRFAEQVKAALKGTEPGGRTRPRPVEANRGGVAKNRPVIPDYQLLRTIGEGSYGEVWLARGATGLHRAVKVVWRERFETDEPYEREWRGLKEFAAISLKTEGQMALLHLGRNDADGMFYYVMELADDANAGRTFDPQTYVPLTLKEWRRRKGRVPAGEVVNAGAELAAGLAALHVRGLVHRDIKPSNAILVNGRAKLADIGLVTAAHDARTFIGTAGYVPPEGPGSPSADVFALGRVLYELATGLDRDEFPKLPDDLERLPDRRELLALNEVVLRACDPRPERRYRHAGEVLGDLARLQAGKRAGLGRRRGRTAALIAVGVVGLGVAVRIGWPEARPPTSPTSAKATSPAAVERNSLAVLPFENRGDATDDAYFADGLHEDLLTRLSSVAELKVISRTTLLRYPGKGKTPREIGEELGVTHVVEGSIRRMSGQVRITARLIDAATDRQIWAQSYDHELAGVFGVQAAMAGAIASGLRLSLSSAEKAGLERKSSSDAAAYDLYLRARDFLRGPVFSRAGVDRAEAQLRQAVALDPEFVQAWAELAILISVRYAQFPEEKTPARLTEAEEAIATARRLAPEAPEVLLGLSQVRNYGYRDYTGAQYYLNRLLVAYPNFPEGHQALGRLNRRQGRWKEAEAAFRKVWDLDPANIQAAREVNSILIFLRRYADIDAVHRQMLVFWPDDRGIRFEVAVAAYRRERSTQAFREWLSAIPEGERGSAEVLPLLLNWSLWRGDEAMLLDLVERHGVPEENLEIAGHLVHTKFRPKVVEILKRQKPAQERILASDPLSGRTWTRLAQIHALLGEREPALAAVAQSRQLLPEASDALNNVANSIRLAQVLLWLGEQEAAVAELERLVKLPGGVHAWVIRDSLVWRPLRHHPRVEAILRDPANFQPIGGGDTSRPVPVAMPESSTRRNPP